MNIVCADGRENIPDIVFSEYETDNIRNSDELKNILDVHKSESDLRPNVTKIMLQLISNHIVTNYQLQQISLLFPELQNNILFPARTTEHDGVLAVTKRPDITAQYIRNVYGCAAQLYLAPMQCPYHMFSTRTLGLFYQCAPCPLGTYKNNTGTDGRDCLPCTTGMACPKHRQNECARVDLDQLNKTTINSAVRTDIVRQHTSFINIEQPCRPNTTCVACIGCVCTPADSNNHFSVVNTRAGVQCSIRIVTRLQVEMTILQEIKLHNYVYFHGSDELGTTFRGVITPNTNGEPTNIIHKQSSPLQLSFIPEHNGMCITWRYKSIQEISIHNGYNIFSLHLINKTIHNNNSIAADLPTMISDTARIYTYLGTGVHNATRLYSVTGYITSHPFTLRLKSGMNLISMPYSTDVYVKNLIFGNLSIGDIIASHSGDLVSKYTGEDTWYGNLLFLRPSGVYHFTSENNIVITYPGTEEVINS